MRWLTTLLFVVLTLTVACADKDPPPTQAQTEQDAAPSAAELDLWAGVPALVAEPDDIAKVLEPVPGPKKPPQAGEEVDTPFPPEIKPTGGPPAVAAGPLQVERFGPEGEQGVVDAVRVVFNQPMVPLAAVESLRAKDIPLVMDPMPKGKARWLGTKTLAWFVDGRLPFSTTYDVRVPAGSKSTSGTELRKDVKWKFSTPSLALASSWPHADAKTIALEPTITLTFNQPVQRGPLLGALALRGGGKIVELDEAPAPKLAEGAKPPEPWEVARVVRVKPRAQLRPNTRYTVSIPGGTWGEGPNRSKSIKVSFRTYPPLRLKPRSCDGPCPANDQIIIESTTPLADPKLGEKVSVEPAIAGMKVTSWGSGIRISGPTVGESTYTVTVDAELTDSFGQKLGKTTTLKARLGPRYPLLQLTSTVDGPATLERSGVAALPLRVAGLEELEIEARGLKIDEVAQFLSANPKWENRGWPDGYPASSLTRKLDVRASRKETQTVDVQLADLLGPDRSSAWLIARSAKVTRDRYAARPVLSKLVQVTDIGIATWVDRRGGIALVTSLSTGEPLVGAEVSVVDSGARTLWAGSTDPMGLAYARWALSGQPRLMLVQHGDDRAFLSMQRNDALGRWLGSAWSGDDTPTPRAFIFTDRTPYKPGDTIHVSGILRLETRGPQGGVEMWRQDVTAKYKVVTPRGVDVAEGELSIGTFGSFSVDIPTDAQGDTGNYSFALTVPNALTGDRTFGHHIPVETYRAPEFEVEVERPESESLVFGDELVAEIRARYLHGAPLVGGEAQFTLRRTTTAFKPPGSANAAFTFGIGGGRWGHRHWWGPTSPSEVVQSGAESLNAQGVLQVRQRLEPPKPAKTPASEDDPAPPQTATFSLQATITDENRQAIAGSGSFVVHPARVYAGIRADRSVLKEGEQTDVQAIVVDLEGKRLTEKTLSMEVVRRETERTAVERAGSWVFEYKTKETPVTKCTLTSADAPVSCTVTAGKAGTYVVRAEAIDDGGKETRSELQLYVQGKDSVVWDQTRRRVDLVPDRDEYKPGDTATILVRSPFDRARGVVLVEREGISRQIPVVIEGGSASVEVAVTEPMLPGVAVSAVLTRGRVEVEGAPPGQDLGMPAAAAGTVELVVSTEDKEIAVSLEPSATEIEPKGKLTLSLTTKTAAGAPISAAVAVMVVDEGVLSLMDYQTPDPLAFFHRRRSSGVWSQALHGSLLPRQVAAAPPTPSAGDVPEEDAWGSLRGARLDRASGVGGLGLVGTGRGGGGIAEGNIGLPTAPQEMEEKSNGKPRPRRRMRKMSAVASAAPAAPATLDPGQAMAQSVSLRTLFATTAFFDAEIRTDDSGAATVEIDMPENLTTFRVMAVAVDPTQADRFGSADTTVRVRKPLMLRPSLPRFANFGDKFEGSVMVDNQTGADQAVLVGTRGLNVTFPGDTQKVVQIPAGESREVRFQMEVDRVGTMRLQFAAMSNAGRDATELSLPVRYPATAQAFADYGMTDTAVERKVEPPQDALPGFGGLELSFSSTALSGLEDAVQYLVDYEYECAEQTASRILPIFVLGKILDEFPIAGVREAPLRKELGVDGLAKLLKNQGYDGGFGYWNDRESWPYLTNWVTFALLEGKRAGFTVDANALRRALDYIENFVRHGHRTRWGNYYDWTSRAFGLWLLSREGRGADLFARVWGHRDDMPLYARAQLMSAAHAFKQTTERDKILAELRELAVDSPRTVHFAESTSEAASDGLRVLMHSNVQTDAIALMALLEVAGEDPMLPKVMAGIMADRDPKRGGRWLTTHANAWALLAASRYYDKVEADEPDYKARVWLDEQFAGEHTFAGRSMTKVNTQVPMANLLGAAQRTLVVGKEGTGKLYYRLGLRYAPKDLELEAEDQGFVAYRTYEALPGADGKPDEESVKRLDDGSWQVKAGTNVKVTIHVVARDRANYVVVDDALPAGFEGQNPRFATSVGASPGASVSRGRGQWWYPWWTFSHTQMRDDRMLLFADHLPAGVYTYSYTARATTVGTFRLPPIKAEAMYEPERFGHSASSTVHVVE